MPYMNSMLKGLTTGAYHMHIEEVNILHISDLHFGIGETDREKSNYRRQRQSMISSLVKELKTYRDEHGS